MWTRHRSFEVILNVDICETKNPSVL